MSSARKNFIDGKFVGHTYDWEIDQLLNKKILFLHIHKAAGTSIKKSLGLWKGRDSHTTAAWIIKEKGLKYFNSLVSFTIIRNPWDRVVSAYHYRKQSNRIPKDTTFEEYVNPKNKGGMVHLPPQIDYIFYKGESVCKEIIHYENLDDEFSAFVKKYSIALEEPLKKHRASKHKNYRDYYTEATKNIVANHFAEEIKEFNYTF